MKKKLHTTKIVAQYLDLSERRVRQLRDEGVLEEKAPGLYDLRSSVRRYINYLRGDEGGKADLNEERAKLTKEKRIAAETENKVRNGELYRKSDIMTGMTTIVMNLRSRLLALPNKLAANIAKLDGDEDKIMDLLQSSLHEIMEEFSNYQVALELPKEDVDEQDGEKSGLTRKRVQGLSVGVSASISGLSCVCSRNASGVSRNVKKKRIVKLEPQTVELFAEVLSKLRPPPPLTVSQWADKYRVLSAESSAEPGRWHTEKAPYQRAIMVVIGDPHVRSVVVMSAAQIVKTDACSLYPFGYYMDYAPCPVMCMQPTLDMGQTLSKDRIAPMIRDTPRLTGLVDTKSRYAGNTVMKKNFPGGHITIVGANSPSSLASRPIKVLLADEIDRYPKSAGTEGDPLDLAKKRQTTFWDYKTVMVSTPTIKGDSRIEDAYLLSTQEEWNVPCPECGAYQPFLWENVKFDPDDLDKGVSYVCRECGCIANEYRWKEQGIYGKYVAANPGAEARGFHLNTLASTFVGWKEVVQKFIEAKIALDHGNPEQMKVWVNTELGETWEERGIQLEDTELFNRREIYAAEVPDDVLYLTAGVDVQDDRFEVEVVGWGEGGESWGGRYLIINGDMLSEQVWDDLDNFLLHTWRKADGTAYPLLATCIDSGGHHTDAVYRFAKERLNRRIFAIKGMGGSGVPFIRNPSKNNRVKADLFILGVDAGKTTIYQRLEVKTPGPNYCHFPSNPEAGYTEEYFKGLTAEKKVVRFVKGRLKEYWEIKDKEHKRNEPLDLRNYATAALAISRPVLKKPDADGTPIQPVKKARGRRQLSGGI